MDDGLIQFLVIAVFVIISMMDGAARKRRKQAQSLGPRPTLDEFSEATEDLDQAAESSEGMVPQDLWQEIAALARGEVPASQEDQPVLGGSRSTVVPSPKGVRKSQVEEWAAPEQAVSAEAPPSVEVPPADLQSGYLHPDQVATHREHVQVVAPAQPIREELPHEFVPHLTEQPSPPVAEPRRAQKRGGLVSELRLGGRRSLREAIIVAEVLSPPVSLRDSDWKPTF